MTTRRRFLVASATVVAGVLTLQLEGCDDPPSPVLVDLAATLPAEAGTVGKAWRKLDVADADPAQALLEALQAAGVDVTDPVALGVGLRALIRDDFAAGRTAEVGGWVLSVSECRLCALA